MRSPQEDQLFLIDAFPYGVPWDLGSALSSGPTSVAVLPSAPLDYLLAALANFLLGVPPLQLLSSLRGGELRTVAAAEGLPLPEDAEIVIEGTLRRASHATEELLGRYGGNYQVT